MRDVARPVSCIGSRGANPRGRRNHLHRNVWRLANGAAAACSGAITVILTTGVRRPAWVSRASGQLVPCHHVMCFRPHWQPTCVGQHPRTGDIRGGCMHPGVRRLRAGGSTSASRDCGRGDRTIRGVRCPNRSSSRGGRGAYGSSGRVCRGCYRRRRSISGCSHGERGPNPDRTDPVCYPDPDRPNGGRDFDTGGRNGSAGRGHCRGRLADPDHPGEGQ